MPFLPDAPRKGETVLAWAQQITDYLRFVYPRGGGARAGSGGASFLPAAPRRGGGSNPAPKTYLPFQLVRWFDELGNPKLRIIASTLQGKATGLPTGFNQPPDGTSWIGAPTSGTRYIFLKVSTTDGEYDSAEILDSATVSPTITDGEAVAMLGTYTFATSESGTTFAVQNFAYGPATLSICEVPYTSPREYAVRLTLAGPSNG